MDLLKGKVAVITGAGSGIGKKTAEIFAREGANLVIAARRIEKLEETAKDAEAKGAKVLCISADVSKEEDCVRIFKEAYEKFGKIDILVNNAGMADKHRPIDRCDTDWWKTVCATNQDSIYYMMREALKYMVKEESGAIVNISSIGGVFGSSGISYSASKAAVIGMTKNVAIEFAGKGIRCNAVCPGPTPTDLNTPEQIATFDSEFAALCNSHMDMSVPEASAEDQANAILFFSCDMSKSVNGQVLVVDNGCTL
ncbi:MAG: SDR family oxidoreductase [Eubacterium sp.]|nr:SDR family oxidoreductase [Eubacterium sp.]